MKLLGWTRLALKKLRKALNDLPEHASDVSECVMCNNTMYIEEPDCDPTPVCNYCAQDIVCDTLPQLLDEIDRLKKQISRLRVKTRSQS